MNTKNITSLIDMLQPKPAPRRRVHRCTVIQPDGEKIPFEFCEEEPGPAVLRELIESPEFGVPRKRIPLALGCQNERNFIIPDLADLPHLLVAGKNDGEVDYAWCTLVLSLLLRQRDEKVAIEVINCDAEGDNLEHFVGLLRDRAKEATDRLHYFDWSGAAGLEAYNSRSPETMRAQNAARQLPEHLMRRVMVLHNPSVLIRRAPEETLASLHRLCKATSRSRFASRDAGIHIIITCDEPTKEKLPDELLKLIPARMVFRTPSRKRLLPGIPAGQKRLRDGEFFYKAHEDAPCLTAVLPVSTDEELNAVLQYRVSHGG